MKPIANFV